MSAYFASHRENSFGHPLDGRLRGDCWVLVPRVSLVVGYGPTNLDTTLFPRAANGWGTKYPVPDMVLPLLAEGGGTTNLKELYPGMICISPFYHPHGHGRAGFHHLSARSNSSLSPGSTHTRTPDSHAWGLPVPGM
jgi:hypothetical protein